MDAIFRPEFVRRALRRRWRTVFIAVVLGLLAGAGSVLTSTVEYRATSVVFLDPLIGNPYSPTTPSTRQEQLAALTTESGLVLSDAVVRSAERAAQDEGVDLGPQVQQQTSTEVPSNSQVVHISFTARRPEPAQVGAQALAAAYLEYRQTRSEAVVEEQMARADEEIASVSTLLEAASADLDAASPDSTELTAVSAEVLNLQEQVRIYANQLGQLRIERSAVDSVAMSAGEIVSPARLPTEPEGVPAPLVMMAIIVVFLSGGILLAFVQEHVDTRLRTTDDVDAVGVNPVLGPVRPWRPQLQGTVAEDAYRLAMNGLQIDGMRPRVVALLGTGIAAPVAVAAGLAQALADSGRSVIVVEAIPTNADGQRAGLSDALQDDGASDAVRLLSEVQPDVSVMTAGHHGADLPDLVQRRALAQLTEVLAAQADVLIIVGPDVRTAVGSAIAKAAGGAVLVVGVATTRQAQLLASARLLEESGARLHGVVLVAAPRGRERRRRRAESTEPEQIEVLLTPAAGSVAGADRAVGGARPTVASHTASSSPRNGQASREGIRTGSGGGS